MNVISKNFKTHFTRGAVGTVFGGSLLLTAGLGMAVAEPDPAPVPDGLVNVTVGGTTILDSVPADVAGNAGAAICGSAAADVNTLAQQVDAQSVDQTVCAGLPGGDLVLTQNAGGGGVSSPVFPDSSSEGAAPGSAETAEGTVPPEGTEGAAQTPNGSAESAQGDTTGAGAAEPPAAEGDEDAG
jgi:hypothetical protein